ncbi:SGNH/GDSL hydrolase family protein [Burkholderia diffusa]|uniref:SGNH/GDSL hydrolase family protein n=1 Tax=Burkholderia diffusa TaxID=488732 RepID=UPI0009BE1209|nr:SGNH/GDSL hydrolase family protein [Burkholderia diffusa]
MNLRAMLGLFAGCVALVMEPAACAEAFYLHNDDTVVFMGDSITEGGAYTTGIEDYVVTRFPTMHVRFVNSGVGKDRVAGGLAGPMSERLQRDVVPFSPTVVAMMYGMNDGRFKAFDPQVYGAYLSGYDNALTSLARLLPDARITLMRPSPYDDVTRRELFDIGYNTVLQRFGDGVAQLGPAVRAHVADLNGPVVSDLRRLMQIEPDIARTLFPDRIHPIPAGGILLAKALLKSWGATSLVSAVDISIGSQPSIAAQHASVRHFRAGTALSWQAIDDALPMPIPDDQTSRFVALNTDFMESLNQQNLRVTGLKAGVYRLSIDGQTIATFNAADLSRGINLARYASPMNAQAADVHVLTLAHNAIRATRWRRVQMLRTTSALNDRSQALQALDRAEFAIVALQREAAQPLWHTFELNPL